ncbi:MAG: hypothetical protein Q8Q85_15305 [Gemmatimonadales bacterium]|nr:hypothetical protein [Gemmatimonadales bacterium]
MSNDWVAVAPTRGRAVGVVGLRCAVIGLAIAAPVRAQVGHDPASSPFHDLTTTQGLTVSFGRFAGARTAAGVGARPGTYVGLRFDTRLSGPADFWASVARVASSRRVVNPDTVVTVTGPVDMPLIAADLGLALNLTGAKTWHRLAPYVGLGIGVLSPTKTVTDPGGYQAATNFSFVPTIGTRVFVGRALAIRIDARDYYFRYEWPLSYYGSVDGVFPPVFDPSTPARQWTHNFALSVGLTYTFTF